MPIIADVSVTDGPTRDELVTEIITTVQGYAVAPDQTITLKESIGENDLTMTVLGSASAGVFEVDEELILVTAVEPASGRCTIHPRGRGWQGTPKTSHEEGAIVADNPALPRARTYRLVNDIISSLYPTLYGVASVTTTVDGPMVELPADATFVIDVRVKDRDDEWQRVRHWEAEQESAHAATTGKAVRLPTTCLGDEVQVVFATRPEQLASGEQRWSQTGLSIAVKDVVVTGVLARVARTLDLGRLTDRFVAPKGDNQQPQLGAGFGMARQLQSDFQAALDREASALRNLYPARAHFTR